MHAALRALRHVASRPLRLITPFIVRRMRPQLLTAPALGRERDEISRGGPALETAVPGPVYVAVPTFLRDHGVMTPRL